jgi:hypothetical protein
MIVHTALATYRSRMQHAGALGARMSELAPALPAGAKVVVSGGSIGEMAMHFIEKYGMMAIKIPSKFDLRRLCRATNATALVKLQEPQADELGFVKHISVQEIGSNNCTVLRQVSACLTAYLSLAAGLGPAALTSTAVTVTPFTPSA